MCNCFRSHCIICEKYTHKQTHTKNDSISIVLAVLESRRATTTTCAAGRLIARLRSHVCGLRAWFENDLVNATRSKASPCTHVDTHTLCKYTRTRDCFARRIFTGPESLRRRPRQEEGNSIWPSHAVHIYFVSRWLRQQHTRLLFVYRLGGISMRSRISVVVIGRHNEISWLPDRIARTSIFPDWRRASAYTQYTQCRVRLLLAVCAQREWVCVWVGALVCVCVCSGKDGTCIWYWLVPNDRDWLQLQCMIFTFV